MLLPPCHCHLFREGMSCTACYYFLFKWKNMLFIKHTHFSTPKGQNWAFWLSTFPDVNFQIRYNLEQPFFTGHLFTSLPFLFAANKLHEKQFCLSEDSVSKDCSKSWGTFDFLVFLGQKDLASIRRNKKKN